MTGGWAVGLCGRVILVVLCLVETTHQVPRAMQGDSVQDRLEDANVGDASNAHNKGVAKLLFRHRRGLIYPGTKWCGSGNVAESYDDIGKLVGLDTCCRQHDNCFDVIHANDTGHGLYNSLSHTSLHCDCDATFRRCLHKVNNFHTGLVGSLYFEVARCFRHEHPARCTLTQQNNNRHRCLEYKYDMKKAKIWQFFDVLPWNYNADQMRSQVYTTATVLQDIVSSQSTSHANRLVGETSIGLFTVAIFVTLIGWHRAKLNCRGTRDPILEEALLPESKVIV